MGTVLFLASLFILMIIFYAQRGDWRLSVLSAAITWGILLTAITEVLSFGKILTLSWLVRFWGLTNIVLVYRYFQLIKTRNQRTHLEFKYRIPRFSIFLTYHYFNG